MSTIIKKLKRQIVQASHSAREVHAPSAFSILDLLWVLYDQLIRVDPKLLNNQGQDRFILGKGHASLALYAVLAEKGFFSDKDFLTFCKYNGKLWAHPDCNKVPGVEA